MFVSCKPDLDYEISGYSEKIIVEGYISNNEYAKVFLSLNVPLWKIIDSVTVLDNVIKSAKVTLSDGENTEVLTGGFWDYSHYPFHMYKGFEMKGIPGKTYFLKVEYSGFKVESKTTIPFPIENLSFKSSSLLDNDTLRILTATLFIQPQLKNSYRVFTKKKKDLFFIETPILFNSDLTLSGMHNFIISPSPSKNDSSFNQGSYFVKGDTVQVKVCAIDSVSTQFFKAMTIFSTNGGIGGIYFIGEKDALKSNVSSPGFGVWCGQQTNYTNVIIE